MDESDLLAATTTVIACADAADAWIQQQPGFARAALASEVTELLAPFRALFVGPTAPAQIAELIERAAELGARVEEWMERGERVYSIDALYKRIIAEPITDCAHRFVISIADDSAIVLRCPACGEVWRGYWRLVVE